MFALVFVFVVVVVVVVVAVVVVVVVVVVCLFVCLFVVGHNTHQNLHFFKIQKPQLNMFLSFHRAGIGRTGLVAVSLISSLFGVSADVAQQYVQNTVRLRRAGKARDQQLVMPETAAQLETVKEVVKWVRWV